MYNTHLKRIYFTLCFILSILPLSTFAGVTEGIQFLNSQLQQEGSYASDLDIATPYQNTAEVLDTFYVLNETSQPGRFAALQFLQHESFQGTEYLSRLIITKAEQGQVVSDLVLQLQSYQNQDGGFGELPGYNSTVLDTIFAAQALALTGRSTTQAAGLAVNFLLVNQHQAGYFSLPDNETSIYITALAAQTFRVYQYVYAVSDNMTRANDYLITQIKADGSAGELFETAAVITVLAPVTADQTIYQSLVDHLQNTQQANGSWAGDVFTTALAIRALYTQQTVTPPQPDQANLSGVIKDGASNNPLINVHVTVTTTDGQSSSAVTDGEGRYLISNIAPGSASVDFNAGGYYPATASVTLIAGQVLTYDTNLLADPVANPIRLSGQVIDVETTFPIADAVIQIINSHFSTQGDSQGAFEILNIPAGSITVEVTQAGYLPQLFSISASAGGPVDLGIINMTPGTIVATESSLSGLMTNAITGEPLRGVLISISGADNQSTFTTQDGRFLLNNIISGNIVVTTSLEGYQNAMGNASLTAGTNLQFNAFLVKTSNSALVTLQGQVIDTETQQALVDVNVTTNAGQTTYTDGDGGFYLSGLEPGTIILEFSAVGYNTVSYSINADSGGSINFAAIALAQSQPVTGNNAPNIISTGPVHAAAGQFYEYQPQAIDPEGDLLIFGLSGNPSGMDINDTTGVIRWIPTTDQVGEQSYTLIVSDSAGAITQQTVIVTVTDSGDPSYVITDVETLNALTVDALLPDNYVLGSYVIGGRAGTWRAKSSQGCGFSFFGEGSDAASITAAANALDFWSMGSGFGSDGIWDLGEALSTVTVLPLIDHAPFPQEGIEYTIWGSDDPDATFPEGWSLATLVTIYSQGWADNATVCGGGVNIDDYAGLYTFGQDQFRYIRLKADNSITIFDTPEHTTYSISGDNSGLPGWQSVESEIDGVVGMVCDVPPQANAGIDILGVTRDSIIFDGTNSQGNIVTYGWDLDNDSEVDLIGDSPEHIFNAGFDGDVSLYVVDDKGCVGTDTVHVTIGLDFPRPDLIVSTIDSANVATNLQTLAVSGSVALTITNQGNAPAIQAAVVTLFEDRDENGQFDLGIDHVLGTQTMPSGLAKSDELTMNVAVNGITSFRDSPIMGVVDSDQQIDEIREDNNFASVSDSCSFTPTSLGDFDFIEKWYRSGDVYGPVNVVQLYDDNGDGQINGDDTPDIIFTNNIGNGRGNLTALSGDTGQVIWKNTSTIVTGYGSPAAGDIDGDGFIDIIIPNNDRSKLHVFERDGTLKWTAGTSPIFSNSPRDAVALADIDHDGDVEIIHGRRAYDHLGNLLWEGSGDYGGDTGYGTLPIIVDLDLQGDMEIIAGRTAYRSDGSTLWRRTDLPSGGGFTAIGNFNQDDNPEIVLVSGGSVYLLDNHGQTIWGPVILPGGGSGGAPTVGDFDGDGEPEIGIAGGRNYVVLETNGSIKWTSKTQDASSHRTGSSLFDFNLDGTVEVVYADELYLRIYDGSTGTIIKQHRLGSGTTLEYPVIADIDGDGQAEIVVGSNSGFSSRRGLFVFEGKHDNWAPTRAIWNQHSYHITNINDDGTVPQFEQPSWLSHNSYRLNTFADRDPRLLTDITASVLTIHDNGNNQPASISVRIGNAGAGDLGSEIGIAFYQGAPASNGILLGVVSINSLAKGTYQEIELNNIDSLSGTADIYVIADYDNRLPECNEVNNRVVLPVLPQTSTGQIAVATNQLVYGPNSHVQLQSTVTNTSGVPGEFKATLSVEDAQGVLVQSYAIHPVGPLAGGVNVSLTELWQTAQYQAGTYILKGELFNLSGEVIHEAISEFEIRHAIGGEPLVALRTTTDKLVYNTNDVAQLFNLAQNLAINQIIDAASLHITVNNSSGTTVFTEIVTAGSLVSGAIKDFTSLYTFTQAAEGTYTVRGELLNSDGDSLAIDQAQFEVQENLQQLLLGQVVVSQSTLERGQLQTCTDTVTHNGSDNFLAQPIRQLLINLDNGEVMSAHDMLVDLSTNIAHPLVREVSTTALQTGGYACVLQTEINGEWISLANDTFILTEPPINILGDLSAGGEGRLLVLLDSHSNHEHNQTVMKIIRNIRNIRNIGDIKAIKMMNSMNTKQSARMKTIIMTMIHITHQMQLS